MELEEMRSLWVEMSVEVEKQKKLTNSLIIRMTRVSYKNKLSKLYIPEAIGAVVCLCGLLFLLVNFYKLNTWYLVACGIAATVILFLLPILSIRAIRNMRSVNITANSYKQALLHYSKGKLQFVFVQKLSVYCNSVLMLTMLPVMAMLISGRDIFKNSDLWYGYVIVFPFLYYFATWVSKKYSKTTTDAENILKELVN